MQVADALRHASAQIERNEAELLLGHVLGVNRTRLHAFPETPLSNTAAQAFKALIARRALGEPISYLLGARSFHSLELVVNAAVLIPRADTETLVDLALAQLAPGDAARVLDLGCGSGAVGLAMKAARPKIELTLVDRDAAALAVAAANASRLHLAARCLLGDWFAPVLGERFDMVLSNPPYLAADDPHLTQGDLRFEPLGALVAGSSGLECIAEIVASAAHHLSPTGMLAIEHGFAQGAAARALFAAAGFGAHTCKDLAGHDRVTFASAPCESR